MFSDVDHKWMQRAFELGKQAEKNKEVPVGAVLVCDDQVIGESGNQPISQCDPTAHAEILALRAGAKTLNNYRLPNTTLYVTLEPCLMCVGAIVHARVQRVVFGAYDLRTGAVKSVFHMAEDKKLNHRVSYAGGLMKEECGNLLRNFFKERR